MLSLFFSDLRACPRNLFVIAAICMLLASCSFLAPEAKRRFILYPVQIGDSLFTIGKRFSVATTEIRAVNKLAPDARIVVGQVLRIPYLGQSLKKGPNDIKAPTGINQARTIEANSASLSTIKLSKAAKYMGNLGWPVGGNGGTISSRFGRRWLSFHEGIDIFAEMGRAILAAHDGRVVYSGNGLRGYGNLVVVQGADILTVYGHNRANLVSVGKYVKRGDRIADLGASGKATGPHLHFETRIKNKEGKNAAVDPLAFYRKTK